MPKTWFSKFVSAALLIAAPIAAVADETKPSGLSIELNQAKGKDANCTLSFLVINGHKSAIEHAVYEAVLFDKSGQIDRLTLFDFGKLPAGRPRVRQFVVPGTACEGLGRILFNGAHACKAGDLGDAACTENLNLKSRIAVEVIG